MTRGRTENALLYYDEVLADDQPRPRLHVARRPLRPEGEEGAGALLLPERDRPISRRWSVPETRTWTITTGKENERCRQEIGKLEEVGGGFERKDPMRAFFRSRYLSGGVLFFFLFFISVGRCSPGRPGEKVSRNCWTRGRILYAEKDYENADHPAAAGPAVGQNRRGKARALFRSCRRSISISTRRTPPGIICGKCWSWLRRKKSTRRRCLQAAIGSCSRRRRRRAKRHSPQVVGMRFRAELKKRKRLNKIELIGAMVLLVGGVVVMKIIRGRKKSRSSPTTTRG